MPAGMLAHIWREILMDAPPVGVTTYALLTKGLPLIISLLTLIYLALRIAKFVWDWDVAREARMLAKRAATTRTEFDE